MQMTSFGLAVPTPKARQRHSVLSAEPPPHCSSKPDPCRAIINLSTCQSVLQTSYARGSFDSGRHHRLLSTRHCCLHFIEKDTHPHEPEDPLKPEGAGLIHRDTLGLRAATAFCSLSCASFSRRGHLHTQVTGQGPNSIKTSCAIGLCRRSV